MNVTFTDCGRAKNLFETGRFKLTKIFNVTDRVRVRVRVRVTVRVRVRVRVSVRVSVRVRVRVSRGTRIFYFCLLYYLILSTKWLIY